MTLNNLSEESLSEDENAGSFRVEFKRFIFTIFLRWYLSMVFFLNPTRN
jgi:hypothetical protein